MKAAQSCLVAMTCVVWNSHTDSTVTSTPRRRARRKNRWMNLLRDDSRALDFEGWPSSTTWTAWVTLANAPEPKQPVGDASVAKGKAYAGRRRPRKIITAQPSKARGDSALDGLISGTPATDETLVTSS